MFENIKAAIFDLDGTLVDSMWIWGKIDIDYLNKHNIPMPNDLRGNIEHMSFKEVAIYFKNRFELPYSIEEIQTQWLEMAVDGYINSIPLKEGVKEFLQFLKDSNIKIGLATSNRRELIDACFTSHDMDKYFSCITTTDEVPRGKDSPDVYLLCAERLEVAPKDCIVFEDILPAVKSAKNAGMKVVAIYDEFSKKAEKEIKDVADKYIHSYNELLPCSNTK